MNWMDLLVQTFNELPDGLGAIICIVLIWTIIWITFGKYEVSSNELRKENKKDS